MAEATKTREVWIDYAKVIGIILVIVGHLSLTESNATTFIYAFHIPLFFFISGYLHKNSKFLGIAVQKDAKRLLLPYVYFYIISYVYWFVTVYLNHKSDYAGTFIHTVVIKPLLGLLVGNGYETNISFSVNHPLWFLIGLFLAKQLYSLLEYFTKGNLFAITLLSFLLLLINVVINKAGCDLWFSLDSAILGLPFLIIGVLLKKIGGIKVWLKNNLLNFIFFMMLMVCTWLLAIHNGKADLNLNSWGQNLLLFYLAGLTGTFTIIFLSRVFSDFPFKIILFISANTLILMCIQGILKSISTTGLKIIRYKLPLKLDFVHAAVLTLTIVAISLPVTYIIDKYLPFLTGVDKNKTTPIIASLTVESAV